MQQMKQINDSAQQNRNIQKLRLWPQTPSRGVFALYRVTKLCLISSFTMYVYSYIYKFLYFYLSLNYATFNITV